jgi:crotonobetainyl-CoA:carnitine CoA-transferase CaiB-like acyl-CoA transferase
VELVNSPINLESGLRPPHAPPLLGEHTADVLREIGIEDAEIERLAAAGAIEIR